MVRPAAALLAALALSLSSADVADAHAALQRASPRVGSTVTSSPTEVRMWFSEALEPAFSGASISSVAGQSAQAAKPTVDAADSHQLVIPLRRPLPAGRYQVKWGVVSVDGHRTEGDFRFTVAASR